MEFEDEIETEEDSDLWNAYAAEQDRLDSGDGVSSGCFMTILLMLSIMVLMVLAALTLR